MSRIEKQVTLPARGTGIKAAGMFKRWLWTLGFLFATMSAFQGVAASSLGYDPGADPFDQYHEAIKQARVQGKLVLIVAGGDWCSWCHRLDRFIARNDEVRHRLDEAFVTVKVYVGDENYNDDFFSQLPAARGAPHFWIVSPQRQVLSSQSTGALEQSGHGYDKQAFLSFIERWKAHERLAAAAGM